MTQPRTRRRVTPTEPRPAGTCHCPNSRPTLIGAYRDGQLIDIRRQHLPAQCGLPADVLDAHEYQRT